MKTVPFMIFFLTYGHQYPDALARLAASLGRLGLAKITLVVIDNADCSLPLTRTGGNAWRMGGDNSCREFSGLQKAVLLMSNLPVSCKSILFVNDSFQNYDGSFLDAIKRAKLNVAMERGAALGVVDVYEQPVTVFGHTISGWIRSNAFFLPQKTALALESLCPVNEDILNDFVDSRYSGRYFKPVAPLSQNLQAYIVEWLTTSWHSKFDITSDWNRYRLKLCAMLNELLLTAHILEIGTPIMNAQGMITESPWMCLQRRYWRFMDFVRKK